MAIELSLQCQVERQRAVLLSLYTRHSIVILLETMEHRTIETKYWTTRVVTAYFGVCAQTLIPWRRGSLPHTVIFGNRMPLFLYEPRKLKRWARENKITTYPGRAADVLALVSEAA